MQSLWPLQAVSALVMLSIPLFAVQTRTVEPNEEVGPVQSLQGTIWTIDLRHKELTVKDASGVPFDFMVEPSTRIRSGDKSLSLGDLLSVDHVTVRFVPEKQGDVAAAIQVSDK